MPPTIFTLLSISINTPLQVRINLAQRSLSSSLLVTWCLGKKCRAKVISLALEVVEVALDSAGKTVSLELGLLVDDGGHSRGDAWLESVVDVVDDGLRIGIGDCVAGLSILGGGFDAVATLEGLRGNHSIY